MLYEASYYQADGKLAVFERHMGDVSAESMELASARERGVHEEYRYDALGRRVLVWARRGASCTQTGCESTVQRFAWAGEQLVYETRGRGADSVNSAVLESETPSGNGDRGQPNAYGTVVYAHASGIDRPLSVRRTSTNTSFFPHGNWRGLYDGATTPAGAIVPCYGSNPAPCANAPDIDWPGSTTSAYIGATPTTRPAGQLPEWAGSLVTEQADASGLLYRRNRYYDPQSGRFTQPDPIGLAGGLNLYGYAGADPVNYSDPFGLCPGPLVIVCVWVLEALPTATIVGAEIGTGLTVGGAVSGRLTGRALRQAGQAGEAAVEAGLLRDGYTILGRQVTARTSVGRRVIDFLAQKPDGAMVAIEAKAGQAVRNASQVLKDAKIAEEGAELVGKNAPEALRGQRIPPIETEVRRP